MRDCSCEVSCETALRVVRAAWCGARVRAWRAPRGADARSVREPRGVRNGTRVPNGTVHARIARNHPHAASCTHAARCTTCRARCTLHVARTHVARCTAGSRRQAPHAGRASQGIPRPEISAEIRQRTPGTGSAAHRTRVVVLAPPRFLPLTGRRDRSQNVTQARRAARKDVRQWTAREDRDGTRDRRARTVPGSPASARRRFGAEAVSWQRC